MEAVVNKLGGLEGVQRFLRGELEVREIQLVTPTPVTLVLPDLDWKKTYGLLGVPPQQFDAEMTRLSVRNQDDSWSLPVLKIFCKDKALVTPNRVVEVLKNLGKEHDFTVYQSRDDLDGQLLANARDPYRDGSYRVGFLRATEPDQKPQLLSYDRPEEVVALENTLVEELLLQLAYFTSTGQHLTVKKVTRCGASRFRFGFVPEVDFDLVSRRLCVNGWDPGHVDAGLRSRSTCVLPVEFRPQE